MKRGQFLSRIFILSILFLFLFQGCENQNLFNGGIGTLQGKVSIGPLCPVERIPPDPACQPTAETYKAYPVSVWSANMNAKILDLTPSLDGSYSVSLPFGTYNIVLENKSPGIGGSNLPALVDINKDAPTEFDISIDTGIR